MLSRSLLPHLARRVCLSPSRNMAESSQAKPKALSTSSASHTFCRTVNASEVAANYTSEISSAIQSSLSSSSSAKRPKLVGILCGQKDSPSVTYADWTKKACESVGIEYELRLIETDKEESDAEGQESVGGAALGAADLETAILEANVDPAINGIMVYYPTGAGQRQDSYLQQVVTREKDVEGLNFSYLFNLYHNIRMIDPRTLSLSLAHSAQLSAKQSQSKEDSTSGLVKSILPCTPLAIVKTLEYLGVYNSILPYGQRAYGRTITVINRSEVVGRPLAALLANDGARVFSVDIDNIQEFSRRRTTSASKESSSLPHHVVRDSKLSLQDCLKMSDTVITGVPSKGYKVKTENLRDGVVAINFSSEKNFEANIKDKASIYLPSIGKMTIAMLQRNLLRLVEYQEKLAQKPSSTASI